MTNAAQKVITVAVAGNPNAGKTTIFNNLTGAQQRVGNYPGVTVEWKEGTVKRGDLSLNIVDLPGTYSLTPYSDEELVARDYLLNHSPDVVIDVLDASNLERNLFLTTELLEVGCPLVVVLNMVDMARDAGLQVDVAALSARLGVPVVPAIGNQGEGMDEIIAAVLGMVASSTSLPGAADVCRESGPGPASLTGVQLGAARTRVNYGPTVEKLIGNIGDLIPQSASQRWQALKLIESDPKVLESLTITGESEVVVGLVNEFAANSKEEPDILLARLRYDFIGQVCESACSNSQEAKTTASTSDRIDRIAMHPVWGVPVFLTLMYLVFTITFSLGNPIMNLIDSGVIRFSKSLLNLWPADTALHLQSLIIDGIIGGVGGVIVFLPNIVLLFMAIAILEGTGYMARAAFVMDRFMSKVGLHGKSFIPLLIGFGCTVPAIMATRTLETRRDRLITMMVLPLISCGARLPIYALLIPAFFAPQWQGPILWLIYVLGISLALAGAMLLRSTLFRGESTPFLMELPPYRMPTAGSLLIQMWTRAWLYIKKAGTVILGAAILLWFLTYFPKPPADYLPPSDFDQTTLTAVTDQVPFSQITNADQIRAAELSYSVAGRVGRLLEPAIRPIGFDWRIGTALVGAVAAKEVFVAQMGIVFAVGEADETGDHLRQRLRDRYSPLVGLCIMIFALISTPCIATFAITRQEAGAIKWALAQSFGLTAVAWIITFITYQAGMMLGWGALG